MTVSRIGDARCAPAMRVESRIVHGYRRVFRIGGSGPALLLIHGIGDSSQTWRNVLPELARTHLVIAPDLLGHGRSAKPRADYSVAAYANGMRDLLGVLGIDRVTLVGHSLGGGVAMQFAYQFPEKTERMVLVASGGAGRGVSPMLRAATLPGASAWVDSDPSRCEIAGFEGQEVRRGTNMTDPGHSTRDFGRSG